MTGTQERRGGFTLVEFLIVVAFLGILALCAIKLGPSLMRFYHQAQARSQLDRDARTTVDTIGRTLRNGRAGTLAIDTPADTDCPATGCPPNSRIAFTTNDEAAIGIRVKKSPTVGQSNIVEMTRTLSGKTTTSIIGRSITGLLFTIDHQDPSIVGLTVRFDRAYDQSGKADRLFTIALPTQNIRMTGAQ
jgi:prepilin-type N-terminal cleavage/methylation domain-containing protein